MLPKLLSPINSYEGVVRVVAAGADEIYCGVVMPGFERYFGSRHLGGPIRGSLCEIPTYDELGKVVKHAHDHDVKVFLTLNMPFMIEEMEREMKTHIRSCIDQGIDSLIIGNMGIVSLVKHLGVELPLIASMYNVILNYGTVEFLRRKGYSRAVLECHLTLPEIAQIVDHSKIPIEVFIHGAGCSNIQRSCMLLHFRFPEMDRALASDKSWARVPCNIPFDVYNLDDGTLESRDTPILDSHTACGVCLVPSLAKIGVYGFKITGRCAGIAYQEDTTRLYRNLLDQVAHGKLASYKETIDSLRKDFHPALTSAEDLRENYCETKRCQYPRLSHAPYKLPRSWHAWTKRHMKYARIED